MTNDQFPIPFSSPLSFHESPELPPGAVADVIIILETSPTHQQSLTSLIGTAQGSFATPQEADDFISRERDAWSS